jgi:hypothetical protein
LYEINPFAPFNHCEEPPPAPKYSDPLPSVSRAWPAVPALLGSVKLRLEACDGDDCSRVVKPLDGLLKISWPAVVLAAPRDNAWVTFRTPGTITGTPALPMVIPVEDAVPMLRAPAASTVTSESPDRPVLLTVSMA